MTIGFNLLRSRLEQEQKHVTEELEQLKASTRPADERREGSPFVRERKRLPRALS